jgi:hypothetical protein
MQVTTHLVNGIEKDIPKSVLSMYVLLLYCNIEKNSNITLTFIGYISSTHQS